MSNQALSNRQSFKQLLPISPEPSIQEQQENIQKPSQPDVEFKCIPQHSQESRLHTPALGLGEELSYPQLFELKASQADMFRMDDTQGSQALNEFTLGKDALITQEEEIKVNEVPPIFDINQNGTELLNGTFKPRTISNHTITEESKESQEVADQKNDSQNEQSYFIPETKHSNKPLRLTVSKKQLELQRVLEKYDALDYTNDSPSSQIERQALKPDKLVVIDQYLKQQRNANANFNQQQITEPSQDYSIGSIPLPMKMDDNHSQEDSIDQSNRMQSRQQETPIKNQKRQQRLADSQRDQRLKLEVDQKMHQSKGQEADIQEFQDFLAGQLPLKVGRQQVNIPNGGNQVFTSRGEPTFRPSTKSGMMGNSILTSARGPQNFYENNTQTSHTNQTDFRDKIKKSKISDRLREHKQKIRELAQAAIELKNSQQEHFRQIYLRAKNKRMSDYFTNPSPTLMPQSVQSTIVQQPQMDSILINNIVSYGGGAVVRSPRETLEVIPERGFTSKQRIYSNRDLLLPQQKNQFPIRDPRLDVGYISNTQQGSRPRKYLHNQLNEHNKQPSLEVLSAVFRDSRTPFSDDGLSRPWSNPSNENQGKFEKQRYSSIEAKRYTPQPMFENQPKFLNVQNLPMNLNRAKLTAQRQKYYSNSKYSKDLLESARLSLIQQKNHQHNNVFHANGLPQGNFLSIPINPQSEFGSFDNSKREINNNISIKNSHINTSVRQNLIFNNISSMKNGPQKSNKKVQSQDMRDLTPVYGDKLNQVLTFIQQNPNVVNDVINLLDYASKAKVDQSVQKMSINAQNIPAEHGKAQIKHQKAKSQLQKRVFSQEKNQQALYTEDNANGKRYKSVERRENGQSIGSGGKVKNFSLQSPSGQGSQKTDKTTIKNIGEYLKNWSSNNFRRKHSIIPGQEAQAHSKAQMTLYETFLNRKNLIKQNHSTTTTSPQNQTSVKFFNPSKNQTNHSVNQKIKPQTERESSKIKVTNLRFKANTQLGLSKRYKVPAPPKKLNETQSSLQSTTRDINTVIKEAQQQQKISYPNKIVQPIESIIPAMETPIFNTAIKQAQQNQEIAFPTTQQINDDEYDDGFIYEDNEVDSEASATFTRNDKNVQNSRQRQHNDDTKEDIVEMDTVNSQPTQNNLPGTQNILTSSEITQEQNTITSGYKPCEQPQKMNKFDGTPFVSRPDLKGLSISDIVQEPPRTLDAQQPNTQFEQLKQELEIKNRQLEEAKLLIEQMRNATVSKDYQIPPFSLSNSQVSKNIQVIVSEEFKLGTSAGSAIPRFFDNKIYYETPRATKNEIEEEEKIEEDNHLMAKQEANNYEENKKDLNINVELESNYTPVKQSQSKATPTEITQQIDEKSSSMLNQTFHIANSEFDEISSQQPSQISSRLGFKKSHQIVDWQLSHLMEHAKANKLQFNAEMDPAYYTETDIEYTIEMFESQYKNIAKAKLLMPYHEKATNTLKALLKELNLPQIERILKEHKEITPSNTLKMLQKSKKLMEGRRLIVTVMRDLEIHESLVADIRRVSDQQLSENFESHTIESIKKLALKLVPLTHKIKETIFYLRDELKIFQRIAALTSRSKTLVNNLFIYKKRDALRFILKEYEAIRQLMSVFFESTKEMPYISGGTGQTPVKSQVRDKQ